MNRKQKSRLTVLIVALLLVAFVLQTQWGFFSKLSMAISGQPFWLIPGFEGAKTEFVGAVNTGFSSFSKYNEYTPFSRGAVITDHASYPVSDSVYFANSDPFNSLIYWDYTMIGGLDRLQMLVETQQMVALENLNWMGDPLLWNGTQQLNVIQYQPNVDRQLGKTVYGTETTYNLTKRTILLVPAEVHLAISIPSAHDNADRSASGWQEGDWPGLELWFKLDFTAWNSLSSAAAQADTLNEWSASYFSSNPANEYNLMSQYNFRGGFPIAGWVQGYLENVGPDKDDEIWKRIKSDTSEYGYLTEASKSTLDAKTQTLPALTGRSLALFSSADDPTEAYTGDYKGFVTILDQARVYGWAQASAPAYFPIYVQALGTLAEPLGLFGSGPWNIYYPAVNYRLRVIYAVYGTFTYLWTVKTSEDLGYPGWETREYEWAQGGDPWSVFWYELGKLFSNPIFQLFFFMFLAIIVIIVLAIFVPGALKLASKTGETGAKYVESKWDEYEEGRRRRRRRA